MRNGLPESSCIADIQFMFATISISSSMWIINNYKSYQKNRLIMHILMMIYNHTNLYMYQLIAVHFMSCFVKIQHIIDENCTYETYI